MSELENYRKEIDTLDEQILRSLNERMSIVKQICKSKIFGRF